MTEMYTERIGFMQGRLSDCVGTKIQAFPWQSWQDEFKIANAINIKLMEWTLDHDRLFENPLMTANGQALINSYCVRNKLKVKSLTGDCFMQSPFWKADETESGRLKSEFVDICKACNIVGIEMIVLPLVDNGSIETEFQKQALIEFLQSKSPWITELNVKILFESDMKPDELAKFIEHFQAPCFGINYDIGNSASLGFSAFDEISAYGERVINVHVKDRLLGGQTVPLGDGNADFESVFSQLSRANYQGDFILQTARASSGNHVEVICNYRDMVLGYLEEYFSSPKN